MHVIGSFTTGTVDNTNFSYISLPNGVNLDTTKLAVDAGGAVNVGHSSNYIGTYISSGNPGTGNIYTTPRAGMVITNEGATTTQVLLSPTFDGGAILLSTVSNANFGTNYGGFVDFRVPISGWSN